MLCIQIVVRYWARTKQFLCLAHIWVLWRCLRLLLLGLWPTSRLINRILELQREKQGALSKSVAELRMNVSEWYGHVLEAMNRVATVELKSDLDASKAVSRETGYPTIQLTCSGRKGTTEQAAVVYSFRNRDPERVVASVSSLQKVCRIPFKCLVVDYGSNPYFERALAVTCRKMCIDRIRVESQGWPWSRAHALNIGVRAANTPFVITTDVDMIFEDDAISEALSRHEANTVVHCRPLWMPRGARKTEARLGDYSQLGGFQFVEKSVFERFKGFDERIVFWGLEDIEWNRRLRRNGLRTIWIDDRVRMYHLWHPPSYGTCDPRPVTSWYDSNYVLMEQAGLSRSPQLEYGALVTAKDRPLLKWLGASRAHSMVISDNYPSHFEELLVAAKKYTFIRLDLGKRFPIHRLPSLVEPSDPLHCLLQAHGLDLKASKNENADYFYLSLPLLKKHGLIDYFLEEDLSAAFLLFNCQRSH